MEAPGAGSAAGIPYIGSRISLISNVDIRYEGILHSIDTFSSTVALQNVRSFGTEGRTTPNIPPNNKVYQFIIFKGKDIKDLTVCEPSSARIPEDPAVVSINVPPSSSMQMMGPSGNTAHHSAVNHHQKRMNDSMQNSMQNSMQPPHGMRMYSGGRMQQHYMGDHAGLQMRPNMSQGGMGHMRHNFVGRHDDVFQRGDHPGMMDHNEHMQHHTMGRRTDPRSGGGRGRGPRGGNRRVVGELAPQPNLAMKKEVSKAFDFEESNKKFDKTKETTTRTSENGEEVNSTDKTIKKSYDKNSSFFDKISCETSDRAACHDSRMDRDKQRQLDCETFGTDAANLPHSRGYRRDYARGGRGRPVMNHRPDRYMMVGGNNMTYLSQRQF